MSRDSAQFVGNDVPLLPGHRIGAHYEVVGRLGEGASAVIFEVARDGDAHGRRWAAKVLRPDVVKVQFVRDKFEAETALLMALQHEHIVRVIDRVDAVFDHGVSLPAFVMELVDGSTLEAYLPLHAGGLSEVLALSIALQVLDAMVFAHARGVVHRDLKPSNILLQQTDDGLLRAVVADFGLAKALGGTSNTRTGLRIGTIAYMAPEQIQDASRVDARADLYALGITLYECLTGALPFAYRSLYEVIQAQISKPVPSVRNIRPDVSPEWDRIIARATAKRRSERYPSSDALLADLHQLGDALGLFDRSTVALEPVRNSDVRDAVGPDDADDFSMRATPPVESRGYDQLTRGQSMRVPTLDARPAPERRTLLAGGPVVSAGEIFDSFDAFQDDDHDDDHDDDDAAATIAVPLSSLEDGQARAPSQAAVPVTTGVDVLPSGGHDLIEAARAAASLSQADALALEDTPPAPLDAEPTAPSSVASEPAPMQAPDGTPHDDLESRRRRALALVGDSGPTSRLLWGMLLLVALGLAALAIGLYVATR